VAAINGSKLVIRANDNDGEEDGVASND